MRCAPATASSLTPQKIPKEVERKASLTMKNEEIWYWHFFLSHCWLLTYNSTCATHILSVNSHFFIDDESKTNLSGSPAFAQTWHPGFYS
jgi:hypothetical protein